MRIDLNFYLNAAFTAIPKSREPRALRSLLLHSALGV